MVTAFVTTRQVAITGARHLGPATIRVPLAIAQFAVLAFAARTTGEVAFGLLIFTQTAVRLGAALALRGAGPLMMQLFSTEASVRSYTRLQSEIRSARRVVVPIGLVLAVPVVTLYDLSVVAATIATLSVVGLLWATTAVRAVAEATKGAGRPLLALTAELLPAPVLVLASVVLVDLTDSGVRGGLSLVGTLIVANLVGLSVLRSSLRSQCEIDETSASTRPEAAPARSRLHLGISTVSTLFLPLIALGITAIVGDPESIGRLSATLRLMAPATIVISGISAGLLPKIVRESRTPARSTLAWSWVLVAVLALPYTSLLLAAPQAIEWVYGPGFAGLTTTVRIVAVGQLLNGLTGVAVEVLQVTGRARAEATIVVATSMMGLLLAILGATVLDLDAPSVGALFFASVLACRSAAAASLVYLAPISQRNGLEVRT